MQPRGASRMSGMNGPGSSVLGRIASRVETLLSRVNGLQGKVDRLEYDAEEQARRVQDVVDAMQAEYAGRLESMDDAIRRNKTILDTNIVAAESRLDTRIDEAKKGMQEDAERFQRDSRATETVFHETMEGLQARAAQDAQTLYVKIENAVADLTQTMVGYREEFWTLVNDATSRQRQLERKIDGLEYAGRLDSMARLSSRPRSIGPIIGSAVRATTPTELQLVGAQQVAKSRRDVLKTPAIRRFAAEADLQASEIGVNEVLSEHGSDGGGNAATRGRSPARATWSM